MLKILSLQLVLLVVAGGLSALLGGMQSAISAVWGGLCYVFPSAVAALTLNFFRQYPRYAGYGFLLGEGLRIMLALVMMVAVFVLYAKELEFLPFLFGLVATSHVFFLVFWKVKTYGK